MDKKNNERKENAFREWVSDNLRYIILIAIIVIAVAIVVVVASNFMGGGNATDINSEASASSSEDIAAIETSKSEKVEVSSSSNAKTEKGPAVDSAKQEDTEKVKIKTPEATKTPTATVKPEQEKVGVENHEAADLATKYLTALGNADPDTVAGIVDYISDDDYNAVASGAYGTSYENIKPVIFDGDVPGSYVIVVSYDYRISGYDTPIPALTLLYMYKNENETMVIASDNNSVSGLFDEIMQKEEVKKIQAEVQARFDAAMTADPALAEAMG